ncbi:MAG TPA: Wzz/FepE/Etk N-terminal domain-containing protein [bacterium]|nr:Wzz/FepE/Etk N-terminal domain-containing protein [bacterium]HPJ71527.1 Wzz/FepE/Etk N-terminal domain-containing protein [bacterium]
MVEPITMTIRSTARSYLEIIFHRKMLLVVPVIFCSLIAWGYGYLVTPVYKSTAVIQVVEKAKENPFIKGMSIGTSLSTRLSSIVQMVKSRAVIEEVIKELNLGEQAKSPIEYANLVSLLRDSISVKNTNNNFIEVSCEYFNPRECRDIVNAITRKIIKENLESQEMETEQGIEWLNKEIELYRRKMEEKEEELQKLQEDNVELLPEEVSNRIYDQLAWVDPYTGNEITPPFSPEALRPLGATAHSMYQLRYSNSSSHLLSQGRELKALEKKRASLIRQMENENEFILTQRITETNPVVRSLRAELTQKQIELARLKVDSTEEHPMVRRLMQEIDNLQESIKSAASQSVREETTSLNPIYQGLKTELNQIDNQIVAIKEDIEITSQIADESFRKLSTIPKIKKEMDQLRRELANLSRSYMNLVNKREQAYVSRRLELQERGTKFNVIDDAQIPLAPFKPNRTLIVVAGFFFGLVLGAALVVLAEVTDHSFEEANQLREFLPMPMLGAVSQIITPEEKAFITSKKRLGLLGIGVFVVVIVIGIIATMVFGSSV